MEHLLRLQDSQQQQQRHPTFEVVARFLLLQLFEALSANGGPAVQMLYDVLTLLADESRSDYFRPTKRGVAMHDEQNGVGMTLNPRARALLHSLKLLAEALVRLGNGREQQQASLAKPVSGLLLLRFAFILFLSGLSSFFIFGISAHLILGSAVRSKVTNFVPAPLHSALL